MYSWLAGKLFPRLILQVIRRPALARVMFTKDAEFIFPGAHSWSAHCRSRDEIRAWLTRFSEMRPDYVVDDVIVSGPPWNMRVAARFHDQIGSDYANSGMHYLRLRWGRVALDQVYLDTQRIERWEKRHPEMFELSQP